MLYYALVIEDSDIQILASSMSFIYKNQGSSMMMVSREPIPSRSQPVWLEPDGTLAKLTDRKTRAKNDGSVLSSI